MSMEFSVQQFQKLEISRFNKSKNPRDIYKTHVAYSGSPVKHPHDKSKIILIADPYSSDTVYYEFYSQDIGYVEELKNIVNIDGESFLMARIWVKKQSVGVRCSPFIVESTAGVYLR